MTTAISLTRYILPLLRIHSLASHQTFGLFGSESSFQRVLGLFHLFLGIICPFDLASLFRPQSHPRLPLKFLFSGESFGLPLLSLANNPISLPDQLRIINSYAPRPHTFLEA